MERTKLKIDSTYSWRFCDDDIEIDLGRDATHQFFISKKVLGNMLGLMEDVKLGNHVVWHIGGGFYLGDSIYAHTGYRGAEAPYDGDAAVIISLGDNSNKNAHVLVTESDVRAMMRVLMGEPGEPVTDIRTERKRKGLCPECGNPGEWRMMALFCRSGHGRFAG